MKWKIKIPSRQSLPMKRSWSEWWQGFYLSRLTITLLSSGKSGVSMFAVASTYRKEIRMKYWYCSCGPRDACFSMFALVTTAPINAALTNLPRSGNHISEGLKGVFSTLPSRWPTSASYLPPFTALVIHSVFTHWPGDVVYLPAAMHQSQSSLIECAACTSCMSVMWQRVRCFVMLAWWKYSPPLSIHFNFIHL